MRRFSAGGDVAVGLAVSLGALAVLRAAGASLWNGPRTIDPWFYTGFFGSFNVEYHAFSDTYYANRIPWIVPGRVFHSLLPPQAAFLAMHLGAYVLGVVFVALGARSRLPRATSVVAVLVLSASPLYYNAHAWDYVDGGVVVYISLAFWLISPVGLTRRRAAAAGFALACAVIIHFLAIVAVAGVVALLVVDRRARDKGVLNEISAGLAGAVAALVTCTIYAVVSGGPVLFLLPQARALATTSRAAYALPLSQWVPFAPRLLVPLTLLAALVVGGVRIRGRAADAREAYARGISVALTVTLGTALVVQLVGGFLLEYTYYFDFFLPVMALATAVVAARASPVVYRSALVVAVAAAALPLGLVYWHGDRSLVGRTGMTVSAVALGTAVAVVALSRRASVARWVLAPVLVGAVALAFDTSLDVFNATGYQPNSRATYVLAFDLMHNLDTEHIDRRRFAFWFDQASSPTITALDSAYLYTASYVTTTMPRVDSEFHRRFALLHPETLVLLCGQQACEGARKRLREAGYTFTARAPTQLARGGITVWVQLLDLHRTAQTASSP